MKRVNFATQVVLAAAASLLLIFAASAASAQTSAYSTSSLGCLPPDLVGETIYSGFESSGSLPDSRNLCLRYCGNIHRLCKHSVGSQNQCVVRLLRNLRNTGTTYCRDEGDPQDIRDCTDSVRDDTQYVWDWNRDAVFQGQMYCDDLRNSCQEDCNTVL